VRPTLAVVATLAPAALLVGCGSGSQPSPRLRAAAPEVARRLMEQRLHAEQLDYTWLACIALGRSYRRVGITRCNVGFGIDPHVEAYCVVLKDGTLATNHEDPSIPCQHDDAGWDQTTITTS
jgi:hypothetical protein